MGRAQALPGTTFSSVAARGAYESEGKAVLTFREFERILALEVLGPYHNEVHATLGRPPVAEWTEGLPGIDLRRPADPDKVSGGISCRSKNARCAGTASVCLASSIRTVRSLTSWAPRPSFGSNTIRAISVPSSSNCRRVATSACHMRISAGRPSPSGNTEKPTGSCALKVGGRSTSTPCSRRLQSSGRVLAAAYEKSKAARRAVSRTELAASGVSAPDPEHPMEDASGDPVATVPMPAEGQSSGVEFW